MANKSIENMFNDVLSAVENPNEGKEAAKYVGGPNVALLEKEKNSNRQKELEEQKQKELEEQRQKELEQKELEAKKQKELEAQRQKELESQRQKELEAQKQKELEVQRQKELESQRQKELEAKKQKELEAKKQKELEAQKQKELEAQKQKELEAKKQKELEAQKQSNQFINKESVSLIIKLNDKYRDCSKETKEAISIFIKQKTEVEIIAAIINENQNTLIALKAIIKAHQAEPVDRAFFLMSLDESLLNLMGKIISNYLDIEIKNNVSDKKIEFCRNLEKSIDEMGDERGSHLVIIQDLLSIASQKTT